MKNFYLKSTSILLPIIVFSFSVFPVISQAQTTKLDKKDIPRNLWVTMRTDFPAWDTTKVSFYINDQTLSEWTKLGGSDYYVVKATGKDFKSQAVYDTNGKLKYSKTTIKNTILPVALRQALESGEYSDWKMTGNQEVIRNFSEDRKYYKVHLEKDGKKTTLYFDRLGNRMNRMG